MLALPCPRPRSKQSSHLAYTSILCVPTYDNNQSVAYDNQNVRPSMSVLFWWKTAIECASSPVRLLHAYPCMRVGVRAAGWTGVRDLPLNGTQQFTLLLRRVHQMCEVLLPKNKRSCCRTDTSTRACARVLVCKDGTQLHASKKACTCMVHMNVRGDIHTSAVQTVGIGTTYLPACLLASRPHFSAGITAAMQHVRMRAVPPVDEDISWVMS